MSSTIRQGRQAGGSGKLQPIRVTPSLSAPSVKNGGHLTISARIEAPSGIARAEAVIEGVETLALHPVTQTSASLAARQGGQVWQADWRAHGLQEKFYSVTLRVTDRAGHEYEDRSLRFSDPIAGSNLAGTANYPNHGLTALEDTQFYQENLPNCAAINPATGYALFGTEQGVVIKVALDAGGKPRRVAQISLPVGENNLSCAVYDPGSDSVLFGANTVPGQVIKVAMGAGDSAPRRVGKAALRSGEDAFSTAVIDPASGYAWFGTSQVPAMVVKVAVGGKGEAPQWAGEFPLQVSNLACGVINPAEGYALFGTDSAPGQVVKVSLADGTCSEALSLESGEDSPCAAVIDTAGGYAYFGVCGWPGAIVKVALGAGMSKPARTASMPLDVQDNQPCSAVINPAAGCAWFGVQSCSTGVPPVVVKVGLGPGAAAPTPLGTVSFDAAQNMIGSAAVIAPALSEAMFAGFTSNTPGGSLIQVRLADIPPATHGAVYLSPGLQEICCAGMDAQSGYAYLGGVDGGGNNVLLKTTLGTRPGTASFVASLPLPARPKCMVLDPVAGYAWLGTAESPARVIKVALGAGGAAPSMVGAPLSFLQDENDVNCAVADLDAGYAWFATNTAPSRVVKVALGAGNAAPTRIGRALLQTGEDNIKCGVLDSSAGYAWFGTGTRAGQVVKVSLGSGASAPARVATLTLPSGEDDLSCAVIDPAAGYAYFGTNTSPGKVVKVSLGSGVAAPGRVGAVRLNPGENTVRSGVILPAASVAWFGADEGGPLPGGALNLVQVALGAGSDAPSRLAAQQFLLPGISAFPTLPVMTLDSSVDQAYCWLNPDDAWSYTARLFKIGLSQKGFIKASRFTMMEEGSIGLAHLYSYGARGNARMAIYNTDSSPTLLWQSANTSNTAAGGWLDLPIGAGTPASLTLPAGEYALAWQVDSGTTATSYAPGPQESGYYIPAHYGAFPARLKPDDATSRTMTAERWSAYLSYTVTGGAPPNDNFSSAFDIAPQGAVLNGYNNGATKEAGEPGHAGTAAGHSVWWKWTAPGNGLVQIGTAGSSFDTLLDVYTGSEVGSLAAVASAGNGAGQVVFTASAGTTYRIAVDSAASQQGDVLLSLIYTDTNDMFADCFPLSGLSGQAAGDDRAATTELGEKNIPYENGQIAPYQSLWWVWTAPVTGVVVFDTAGSNHDTVLGVFTGTALDNLQAVTGNDNDDDNSTSTSRLSFRATAGITYYITVNPNQWFSPEGGDVLLHWNQIPVPANDMFAGRFPLRGNNGTTAGINIGASLETSELNCYHGRTVWWTWTAPASGPVTIDTAGSDFNTVMILYTGSDIGSLNYVDGNDDADSTVTSRVDFRATAGVTYQIMVDGAGSSSPDAGNIKLNWNLTPAPVNDDLANRITLTGLSGSVRGTNVEASMESGENFCYGGRTVWWSWTAPASGHVTIDTAGSDFDTEAVIYTGSDIGSLNYVEGNDDADSTVTSRVDFWATAGVSYQIMVDGSGSSSPYAGNIKLNWNLIPAPANDLFANAAPLRGDTGTTMGTNVGAYIEPGEPLFPNQTQGRSVWWRWTAPHYGKMTVTTIGSGVDTLLGVYTGSAVSSLATVARDSGSAGNGACLVQFMVNQGLTYAFAVDSRSYELPGDVQLNWSYVLFPDPNLALVPEPAWTLGTQNTVAWNSVAEATTYTVQRSTKADFSAGLASVDVTSPTLSCTFTGLADGVAYWYRARYNGPLIGLGNWCAATSSTQDNTPPGVVLSTTAPNLTCLSPIPVVATFSESVSGFTAAGLMAESGKIGNFKAVSGNVYTFDLQPNGQGTVAVRVPAGCALDGAGNPNTASARLQRTFDNVVPAYTAVTATPAWAGQGTVVTIAFTASEAQATTPTVTVGGHAAAPVSKNGLTYSYQYTIASADANGAAPIAIQGTDLAGNSGTAIAASVLKVDKTAPSGTILLNGGAAYTSSSTVRLTLSASDSSGSGVTRMRFTENPSGTWTAWENYATGRDFTLASGDGARTVYAQFQDAAGNISAASAISDGITLDTKAPQSQFTSPQNNTSQSAANFTLKWSSSDTAGGSGVRSVTIRWKKDNGPTGTLAGSPFAPSVTSASFAGSGNGVYTFTCIATDKAGNVEPAAATKLKIQVGPRNAAGGGWNLYQ